MVDAIWSEPDAVRQFVERYLDERTADEAACRAQLQAIPDARRAEVRRALDVDIPQRVAELGSQPHDGNLERSGAISGDWSARRNIDPLLFLRRKQDWMREEIDLERE